MPVKSKESVSPCEISLDIEVESSKVAEAVDRAYREFSKYVTVPGFRVGKAPMAFVRQRVPQEQLRERTVELLIGPAYEQALADSAVQPFARPNVELVRLETSAPDYGLEFKALVPLAPTVTLGPYKGLETERPVITVSDEDVDERVMSMVRSRTAYPIIEDGTAQIGDVIAGRLSILMDGEYVSERPEETAITLGDADNIPGIDEALVGMAKGETREFDLVYPDTYARTDLAGKTAHFEVSATELHRKVVPVLNDEFVESISDLHTVDEYKQSVRAAIEKSRRADAEGRAEIALIDKIVSASTIEFPGILLQLEIEKDVAEVREAVETRGIEFSQYLAELNLTAEQLGQSHKEVAATRLRRSLVLSEVARQENITVGDEDIDHEIRERAGRQRTSPEAMRAYIERTDGIETLRNRIFTQKIIAQLMASATVVEPAVPSEPAAEKEDKPAPKKSRKKKPEAETVAEAAAPE